MTVLCSGFSVGRAPNSRTRVLLPTLLADLATGWYLGSVAILAFAVVVLATHCTSHVRHHPQVEYVKHECSSLWSSVDALTVNGRRTEDFVFRSIDMS